MKPSLLWILSLFLLVLGCRDPVQLTGSQMNPADQGTELWEPVFLPPPEKEPCTEARKSLILEPVTAGIVVDCNLTLQNMDVVTRTLVFRGEQSSGVTLECNGATIGSEDDDVVNIIQIRSAHPEDGVWIPVHDVTINNCNVIGGIRIWGIAPTGSGEDMLLSSRTIEHVSKVRDSAPYLISLNNLSLRAMDGWIPLYFSPGTHHSTISNSVIYGDAKVLIYLGAESFGNTIDDNTLDGSYNIRETIAVDASSDNRISNNQMVNLNVGGVYLYRNCGENGVSRHTTPSHNEITGNDMLCLHNPSPFVTSIGVYLGARDGARDRGYCDDDAGYDYGSSVSDQDHARYNVVTGNEFWNCVIETGNATNHSNTVEGNEFH